MKRIILPVLIIGLLLLGACGTSATTLEFGELAADNEPAKWENELGRWKPATGIVDSQELALTSEYFQNIYVARDDWGSIQLIFEWNEEGSQLCEQITARLIDQPMGIFEGDVALLGDDGLPLAPIVLDVIIDQGVISGLSLEDAMALLTLLNIQQKPRTTLNRDSY
ncbi:MAG: hypothetical protein PVJ08_07745 [Dehalococcoidia bacterium]|jgi:preprotein translocase subunit SecD